MSKLRVPANAKVLQLHADAMDLPFHLLRRGPYQMLADAVDLPLDCRCREPAETDEFTSKSEYTPTSNSLKKAAPENFTWVYLKQTRGRFSKVQQSGTAKDGSSGRRTTVSLWEVQTRVILLVLPLSAKAT